MSKNIRKLQPRVINYEFRNDLKRRVASHVFVNSDHSLQRFCDINIEILNKHAPLKKRYLRGNKMPFVTKNKNSKALTQ